MTSEEIVHIGPILFGQRWKTRMAEEFGVHKATVTRWANGEARVPNPVALALAQMWQTKQRREKRAWVRRAREAART